MFYFIHVQGQNALTTLLHLADELSSSTDKKLISTGLYIDGQIESL